MVDVLVATQLVSMTFDAKLALTHKTTLFIVACSDLWGWTLHLEPTRCVW